MVLHARLTCIKNDMTRIKACSSASIPMLIESLRTLMSADNGMGCIDQFIHQSFSLLNEHRHQRRPAGRVSRNKHDRAVELTTAQQCQCLIGIVEGKMSGVAMYRSVLQFFKKRCAIVAGKICHRSYAALAP
jgi:hypothetical protein